MTTIGVAFDPQPGSRTQEATLLALEHARHDGGVTFEVLPTSTLASTEGLAHALAMDGLLLGPGSPYVSLEGALALVRGARERGIPFVGT